MKASRQKAILRSIRPVLVDMERLHPYRMLTYLLIMVICLTYASISFFFIRYLAVELEGNYAFALPDFFVLSTIVLISTFHVAQRIVPAFNKENLPGVRRNLIVLAFTGVIFMMMQTMAWLEIIKQSSSSIPSHISTYLLIFSCIHFAQVVAGVVMSVIVFYEYLMVEQDAVKTLIMITNPYDKAKLSVIQTYWSFIVFSWLALFMMFLIVL